MKRKDADKTQPVGVSAVKTRPTARAIARRSDLEPIFGAQRRFDLTRAPEGFWVSDLSGKVVLRVAARQGPFWKRLGRGKTGSPERTFDVLEGKRPLGVLRLDAVFVDRATGQMEHRGHGALLDALESKLLTATLRKDFSADGLLPDRPDPVISLIPERGETGAWAGERRVGTIFVLQTDKPLETLRRYELAFESDAPARERVWVAALVLLGDLWSLEAERRQR